jgi:hypothetical protein
VTAHAQARVFSAETRRALSELSDQARHRLVVPFVGAGASAHTGLPDWQQLVGPLGKELNLENQDRLDLLDVAQWYTDTHGRADLERRVRGALAGGGVPSPLHASIARLDAPVLLTTNFDTLLEQALEEVKGVPADVIIEDAHIGLIDEARRTSVAKLHGCVSLPSSIVLTRDDYEAYVETHRAMVAYLQALLATRTFLFVGYSLSDPDLRSVYSAIRRALGRFKRKAYLLDSGPKAPQLVDYWHDRGLEIVLFDAYAEIPGFVDAIVNQVGAGRTVSSAAIALESPPPQPSPLQIGPLLDRLDDLQQTLVALLDQATDSGLVPPAEAGPVEMTAPDAAWVRDKARALLDLSQAVDRVAPLDDPLRWIALADLLYEQGDTSGAIAAYNTVLRPSAAERELDRELIRRVQGNLARAHGAEGQYARAEWLLRRCVFERGQQLAEPGFDRRSVYDRLCLEHLRVRPTDASELTFTITRRAEDLIRARRLEDAFDALREARYLLEPTLDIGKGRGRFARSEDLFTAEMFGDSGRRRPSGRYSRRTARVYNPKAWAFNFLGKTYRMSCELALDLGMNTTYYLEKALRYLHFASNGDHLLPYPYAHRLMLEQNHRLSEAEPNTVRVSLRPDLARLRGDPNGKSVFMRLRRDFPKNQLLA